MGSTEDNACNTLAQFWSAVDGRGDPRLASHPMQENATWKSTYIPMAMHGDAVPVVKVGKAGTKSFDITSISPLMAVGETQVMKQFMYGMFESSKVSSNHCGAGTTIFHIWKVVLWSLHFAFLES